MSTERGRAAASTWVLRAGFGLAVAANMWGLYAPEQLGDPLFPGVDKVAHLGSFALVMLLGQLVGIRPRLLASVLVVHAAASEVVQHVLLPGRSGDVIDLLADVVGIGLGWALAVAVRRARRAVARAGTDRGR